LGARFRCKIVFWVLQELAKTPLMLSVMSLAFQGGGADELATQKRDSPEERRKQIFHLYVEKMFQRKGTTSLEFPKEKVSGWLSWLAREMRNHLQSVFFVEDLQPSWLGEIAQQTTYLTVQQSVRSWAAIPSRLSWTLTT